MPTGYTIDWLGWNNEGTSDKVWGYLRMKDGRYFAFWARRGKTFKFKEHKMFESVLKVRFDKEHKRGYTWVNPSDYDRLVSDFITKLEVDCMSAILSEKVM